MNHNDLNQQRT